jgi:AraC-like DNA-binding protein
VDEPPSDLRAIVRPAQALEHFTLERFEPDARTGRFVERFWRTAWDLPEPFTQTIVAFPVVNLVFEADGSATVTGVLRGRDERRLDGSGWALGVMFRPGGFRPLLDASVATLTNRRVPADEVFGPRVTDLSDAIVRVDDTRSQLELITGFLAPRLPDEVTVGEELSALVGAAVSGDRPVIRVSELARCHGTSVRTLQRLFAENVGVGPKAVLDRYRVLAAAELARNPPAPWSAVVHQLGYADQAHLTADLSARFGSPPAAYARDQAEARHI